MQSHMKLIDELKDKLNEESIDSFVQATNAYQYAEIDKNFCKIAYAKLSNYGVQLYNSTKNVESYKIFNQCLKFIDTENWSQIATIMLRMAMASMSVNVLLAKNSAYVLINIIAKHNQLPSMADNPFIISELKSLAMLFHYTSTYTHSNDIDCKALSILFYCLVVNNSDETKLFDFALLNTSLKALIKNADVFTLVRVASYNPSEEILDTIFAKTKNYQHDRANPPLVECYQELSSIANRAFYNKSYEHSQSLYSLGLSFIPQNDFQNWFKGFINLMMASIRVNTQNAIDVAGKLFRMVDKYSVTLGEQEGKYFDKIWGLALAFEKKLQDDNNPAINISILQLVKSLKLLKYKPESVNQVYPKMTEVDALMAKVQLRVNKSRRLNLVSGKRPAIPLVPKWQEEKTNALPCVPNQPPVTKKVSVMPPPKSAQEIAWDAAKLRKDQLFFGTFRPIKTPPQNESVKKLKLSY